MVEQRAKLITLLSPARMAPYLDQAGGDPGRAADLYLWSTEVAGALHAQLSYVELAVRNALDPQLCAWNTRHGGSARWTEPGAAQGDLYTLLGPSIMQARQRAQREAALRGRSHRRHGAPVVHDDMVAQLMFGSWVRLLRPLSTSESPCVQERLWKEGLHLAFPGAGPEDDARLTVGNQLDTLRYLRNRIAHHDNLLTVNVRSRLNAMLSVLSKSDPHYASLAMARSPLRRLIREDPRPSWTKGAGQ